MTRPESRRDRPEIDDVACNTVPESPVAVRPNGPRTGALDPCGVCFEEDDPSDFEWVARGGQHAQRVHKLPECDVSPRSSDDVDPGPSPLLTQLQREDVTSVDDLDLRESGSEGDA